MAIYLRIHEIMGKHRMTQKEVADKTGIRPTTISHYYHDVKKGIDKEHLNAFCKLFKCTPGDLIVYVPDSKDD